MIKKEILSNIEKINNKKEFEKFFYNLLNSYKKHKSLIKILEKKFDIIFERIDPKFLKEIYYSIPLSEEIKLLFAKIFFKYGDLNETKNILKNLESSFNSLSNYSKYTFISIYSAILIEEGNIRKALVYINKGLLHLSKKFKINLKILKNEIIRSYFSPELHYSELLSITKKLKDKRKYLSLLIQEALLNFYKGKFEKSYDLIEEGIEIARNKKLYDITVIFSCIMARIERLKGNFEKSLSILNSIEEYLEKSAFLGKYYFLIEKTSLCIDWNKFEEARNIISKINEKNLPPLLKSYYYLLLMRLARKETKFYLFNTYSDKFFSFKFLEIVKKWEGLIEKFLLSIEKFSEREILKYIETVRKKKLIYFEFLFETCLFIYYLKRKEIEKAKRILTNFKRYPEAFFGYFRRDALFFYRTIKENKIDEFIYSNHYLKKILINILSDKDVLLKAIKDNEIPIEFLPEIIVDKKIYSKSIFKEISKKGKEAKK